MNSNNNKRSLDDHNDKNNSNKKICINNNNIDIGNSNNNKNQFLKSKNEYKMVELKEIAKGFNLKLGGNKEDVYNRILEYINNVHQPFKNEQIEKESINPFNKGPIELTIKDVEQIEKLFWLIFRNKHLFNFIFSKFQFKRTYSYNKLISPKYIIENYSNGKEIIIDKFKSKNHYLNLTQDESMKSILQTFNENCDQNNSIYNQIITRLSSYKEFVENLSKMVIINGDVFILEIINPYKETIEKILKLNTNHKETLEGCFYKHFKMAIYLNSKYGIQIFSHGSFTQLDYSNIKLKQLVKLVSTMRLKNVISMELNIKLTQLLTGIQTGIDTLPFLKSKIETDKFTNEQLESTLKQLLDNGNNLKIKTITLNKTTEINQEQKSFIKGLLDVIPWCRNDNYSFWFNSFFNPTIEFYKNRLLNYEFNYGQIIPILDHSLCGEIIKSNNLVLISFILNKEAGKNIFINQISMLFKSIQSTKVLDVIYENQKDLFFNDGNINWQYFESIELLKHYESLMKQLGRFFYVGRQNGASTQYSDNYGYTSKIFNQILFRALTNPHVYKIQESFDYQLRFENQISLVGRGCEIYKQFIGSMLKTFNNPLDLATVLQSFNESNHKPYLWISNHLTTPLTSYINNIVNDSVTLVLSINNNQYSLELSKRIYIYILYLCGNYEEVLDLDKFDYKDIFSLFYSNPSIISLEFIDLLFAQIMNNKFSNINGLYIFFQHLLYTNNYPIVKLISVKYPQFFNKPSKSNNSDNTFFTLKNYRSLYSTSSYNNNYEINQLLLNYIYVKKK